MWGKFTDVSYGSLFFSVSREDSFCRKQGFALKPSTDNSNQMNLVCRPSTCLSFIHPSTLHPSISASVLHLSIPPSTHPSIHPFIRPSFIHSFIRLSVYLQGQVVENSLAVVENRAADLIDGV